MLERLADTDGHVRISWDLPRTTGNPAFTTNIFRYDSGNVGSIGIVTSGLAASVTEYIDTTAVSSGAYHYQMNSSFMGGAESVPAIGIVAGIPPIASASTVTPNVVAGDTVTLTASGTDRDAGDSIATYAWSQIGTPMVVLSGANTATPTFIAPDITSATTLTFSLIVTDSSSSSLSSAADTVEIIVTAPPTANAGNARNVGVGATITLDGSASNDLDTAAADLTFTWSFLGHSAVTVDEMAVTVTGSMPTPVTGSDAIATFPTTFNADFMPVTTPEAPTNIDLPSGTVLTFSLLVMDDATTPNEDTDTVEITIGGSADEKQVAAIVSEIARAIVSSTVSAVTSRISNVASGVAGTQVAGLNIGGLSLNDSNMASALQTNAQAFATNSDAMKTLLGNSDFSLPLNAVGDGGGGFGSVGIWASGEYSDLSGESDDLDWDGELTGFHLGIDGKIRTSGDKNILIGVALSSLNGDLDYENETATATANDKGNYEIDMTTVSPYIGWRAGVVDLWASVGFGEGEVELTDDADMKSTSDAEQTSFAIGGSVADIVVNKNYSVKLKGELSASEFDIDDSDDDTDGITEQTVDATRARISVEASRISDLENGRAFEKSAEIGARFDGGDGETGAGVEIGGKLKYHAANGFTAEGSARVLLGHSGDYQEWGIQGTIRKQVRRDGQGLTFHLTPAYGDVNSSVSQLLAQGLNDDANNTANPDYHMNLTTRLGYGIAYRGMVTPYTEMVLGTSDEYRMGINWKPSKTFNLTLLGEQTKQNTIRLQGAINF